MMRRARFSISRRQWASITSSSARRNAARSRTLLRGSVVTNVAAQLPEDIRLVIFG
jgi:hypothetical protein